MKFIADFHIHSHCSIATSKKLDPQFLDMWGMIKGVRVIGTGDFTHHGWIKELKEKLEPAEPGLFRLKDKYRIPVLAAKGTAPAGSAGLEELLPADRDFPEIRFMLTSEISNIYKKDGKVRKVHNLIFVPDFRAAEKIRDKLDDIGNIDYDGRPILGMDSKDLLDIALNASEDIFFVPAHIWTPWFSVLGSKSGFNTIEECYEDLSEHIYTVETGLSSDPPMNRQCSFLDKYTLISNSDAHSPEKIGRECNLFDTELDYYSIVKSLKVRPVEQKADSSGKRGQHRKVREAVQSNSGKENGFLGTVEFFPQEGKYHYDGHRKCGIRWNPEET
ncbi:MAG: hypothetical protein KAS39_03845, partial [Actinomycetia bacterium]|nr:hypothetical protein [Actinomycetes bacterium]